MLKFSPANAGVLTKQQKQDFQDCFLLLDTEKTGRLNADNLTSAFQLLNIEVRVIVTILFSHCQVTATLLHTALSLS